MPRGTLSSLMLFGLLSMSSAIASEGGTTETVTELGPVSVGAPVPTFAGYDNNDAFVRSKGLLEEAKSGLIVSFFATWCGPCKAGMPVIEKNVAEREGWKAVFIDLGEEPAKVKPFLASIGVTGTVVYDKNGMIGKRYGVATSLPKTFVVAPDGTVKTIFVTEGGDFDEKLKAAMDAVTPPVKVGE